MGILEDIGEAAFDATLGWAAKPVGAVIDAVGNWDPWTHFTSEPAPASPANPALSRTLGEMHNAPPLHVAEPSWVTNPDGSTMFTGANGGRITINPTEPAQPLGLVDPMKATTKDFSFSSVENVAPATPPAPAATAPAPAPAPADDDGIELDLDFGSGFRVHVSGLDEESTEQLLDHLASKAAQSQHDFGGGARTTEPSADHSAHGWDGKPIGDHPEWRTLTGEPESELGSEPEPKSGPESDDDLGYRRVDDDHPSQHGLESESADNADAAA